MQTATPKRVAALANKAAKTARKEGITACVYLDNADGVAFMGTQQSGPVEGFTLLATAAPTGVITPAGEYAKILGEAGL